MSVAAGADGTAKLGNTFVVPESVAGPLAGFYRDDCRHVSRRVLPGRSVRLEIVAEDEIRETVELDASEAGSAPGPRVDADFEPMLVLRGFARVPRPEPVRRLPVAGGVRLERTGADGVLRTTTVTARADGRRLHVTYRLENGHPPEPVDPPPLPEFETDDADLQAVLDRALEDLRMLRSTLDGEPYLSAGVPWYATLFGRDALLSAMMLLHVDPSLARGTLRLLAARVGREHDPWRAEEPGKVPHEVRGGELAPLALTPLTRYYGAVDATPLFLCALEAYEQATGDRSLADELRAPVAAMRGWMADGLLAHPAPGPGGLRNQGWKDSDDGVIDGDGRPLEHPIALVEANGYAVRAGGSDRARVLERFWLEDRGFYAMAIGGDGAASGVLASNQGHLLWSRVLGPARARAVRDALMGPRAFSGWGIRTLADGEPGYEPESYHRGSVWPHDTALIAAGLRTYGFAQDFQTLLDALVEAAVRAPDRRLPELFSGAARSADENPRELPRACRPQAWAAAALPYLLTTGEAALPSRAKRLTMRGLHFSGRRVDVACARDERGVVSRS